MLRLQQHKSPGGLVRRGPWRRVSLAARFYAFPSTTCCLTATSVVHQNSAKVHAHPSKNAHRPSAQQAQAATRKQQQFGAREQVFLTQRLRSSTISMLALQQLISTYGHRFDGRCFMVALCTLTHKLQYPAAELRSVRYGGSCGCGYANHKKVEERYGLCHSLMPLLCALLGHAWALPPRSLLAVHPQPSLPPRMQTMCSECWPSRSASGCHP